MTVSKLCKELGLRPTVFYCWQKELFESGAAAFQSQERPHRQVEEKQKRIEFLERYLLEFYARELKRDNRYHRLTVKVNRRGLRVQRRGYFAAKLPKARIH